MDPFGLAARGSLRTATDVLTTVPKLLSEAELPLTQLEIFLASTLVTGSRADVDLNWNS